MPIPCILGYVESVFSGKKRNPTIPQLGLEKMRIRVATQSDVEGIVRVGRASFAWAIAQLFTPGVLSRYFDETYSPEKIGASLSKPNNIYFAAESQDNVVDS